MTTFTLCPFHMWLRLEAEKHSFSEGDTINLVGGMEEGSGCIDCDLMDTDPSFAYMSGMYEEKWRHL